MLKFGKSMTMMINAGSKGSMLKFVQQTARIGLRFPASKFPSEFLQNSHVLDTIDIKSLITDIAKGTGMNV